MHLRHRRHSGEWPPSLDPADPAILHWRQKRAEETLDDHQDRIAELERRQLPDLGTWPWLQIIGLGLLFLLGVTGRLSPETIENLSKLLPGR